MFSFFKRTTPQNELAFVDIEVGSDDKIHDLAALRDDDAEFHNASVREFLKFIGNTQYLCGHNIIRHDLKYLRQSTGKELNSKAIDTLYWAPLLFPKRPYHRLLKDDKLQSDELNNPLNDCKKAKDLFCDELTAFSELTDRFRQILFLLLGGKEEFTHFFHYNIFTCAAADAASLIRQEFEGKLCSNADIAAMAEHQPVELAYALALINADDDTSVTPPWVLHNYPAVGNVLHLLRSVVCKPGCPWCNERLNIHRQLKNIFGFDGFRLFGGEPLQENAVRAAVDGKSLVAVFPTGGGKSLTFQLPALMAGRNSRALTVVISPLQSLMKDQVDNLDAQGIHEAVTVNGLLDPIERANSFKRVSEGDASILYISPESLRSKTVENILLHRQIARFVVDEAHCFSAWGQDFRVDYLYIADFIRKLQRDKNDGRDIPVSCFTATAKQKVISDIRDYFMKHLSTDMELYTTAETRKNLRYTVLHMESDDHKYNTLRNLLSAKKCPAIVYVSRTKRSRDLAERLTHDGIEALPFNGKMEADDKTANQEAFIRNDVQAIVATSAFGMGVDKKDVGLVVHYDISGSLEDYVQESGRAGRDPQTEAECYVLYNDSDLDKHFLLLNQTKLSISEIQQVWAAIKKAADRRHRFSCSPLELARLAGWDDSDSDIETRVKTAVAALENAGFIKRGRNMPRIYATGILVENMQEAARRIDESTQLADDQRTKAKRIIKSLISSRSRSRAGTEDAESRVDYLADTLGIPTLEIVNIVNLMRQDGILADTKDMSAYIYSSDTERKSATQLRHFAALEEFLLKQLDEGELKINMKELNEMAQEAELKFCNVKHLRSLLYFLCIAKYIRKEENQQCGMLKITPLQDARELMEKSKRRSSLCDFILNALYAMPKQGGSDDKDLVQFSVIGLFEQYKASLLITENVTLADFEEALLYLSKIGAMKIEGGFMVLYNAMSIERIITDNKIRYTLADYSVLNEFYKMRMQQIHIVGEYANLMVNDMNSALQFVRDYFMIDYNTFINKYFKGQRKKELSRNITSQKYQQLFGSFSPVQSEIINDGESQYIVVAAGPGSGKTRILVHKLAALLLMEDVKHEQLLMLTFSRAAATEFKKRLIDLIGGAAYFVEIKTFHSYCFDILGKVGNIEESGNIVRDAVSLIRSGEAEQGHITKTVLVIDEAQDMDENEFALTEALIEANPQMRVIAVGDDDQNIYEFRGSSSQYLQSLADKHDAKMYVLPDNYRSCRNIVELSNQFAAGISHRMKSSPINAVNQNDGTLSLIRHTSPDMEEAVAEQLIGTRDGKSCCVLTMRNSEALAIHSLLLNKGVPSKLIQSLGGFDLSDLAEIRFFLKQLNVDAPTISDEKWNTAKNKLRRNYGNSACLPMCERLLKDFSDTRRERYYSDFRLFLKESKYEDFIDGGNTVLVSTIHKAKGREFDKVYMMLKNTDAAADEEKRVLYVGMTRAKEALCIHCNTEILDALPIASQITVRDNRTYSCPSEIILQLGHRDVVLSYFKGNDKLWLLQNLRSGDSLRVDLPYLCAGNKKVLKLSNAARENISRHISNGYQPDGAEIRFIVAWREDGDTEEIPVILPDIRLKRK